MVTGYKVTITQPGNVLLGEMETSDVHEDWLALAVHQIMLPIRKFYASHGYPVGDYTIKVETLP